MLILSNKTICEGLKMKMLYIKLFLIFTFCSCWACDDKKNEVFRNCDISPIVFHTSVATSSVNLFLNLHEATFKKNEVYTSKKELEIKHNLKLSMYTKSDVNPTCVQYIELLPKISGVRSEHYLIKIFVEGVVIEATNEKLLNEAIKRYFKIIKENGVKYEKERIFLPVGIFSSYDK